MAKIEVQLVKYDMDKTKSRKRKNFLVDAQTEQAIIDKLERIHKGEKLQVIHEIVWGEEQVDKKDSGEVLTGTVKFFDDVKGFGFIVADNDIQDLFFHISAVQGPEVRDADIVQFEIGKGPKGQVAVRVQLKD